MALLDLAAEPPPDADAPAGTEPAAHLLGLVAYVPSGLAVADVVDRWAAWRGPRSRAEALEVLRLLGTRDAAQAHIALVRAHAHELRRHEISFRYGSPDPDSGRRPDLTDLVVPGLVEWDAPPHVRSEVLGAVRDLLLFRDLRATELEPYVSRLVRDWEWIARGLATEPPGDGSAGGRTAYSQSVADANTLCSLLARAPGREAASVLRQALSCPDPAVAQAGAMALLDRGEHVDAAELERLARDPRHRGALWQLLDLVGQTYRYPRRYDHADAHAEGAVADFIASVSAVSDEAPPSVALLGRVPAPAVKSGLPAECFVYRVELVRDNGAGAFLDVRMLVVGPFLVGRASTPLPRHAAAESTLDPDDPDLVAHVRRALAERARYSHW